MSGSGGGMSKSGSSLQGPLDSKTLESSGGGLPLSVCATPDVSCHVCTDADGGICVGILPGVLGSRVKLEPCCCIGPSEVSMGTVVSMGFKTCICLFDMVLEFCAYAVVRLSSKDWVKLESPGLTPPRAANENPGRKVPECCRLMRRLAPYRSTQLQ